MSKILVLTTTINEKSKSRSLELLNAFMKEYQMKNPKDEIHFLDLNKEKMAETSLTSANLAEFFSEELAVKYIKQLKEVDKLIIATPMHNLMIPANLKNYIDHIAMPEMTFSYKMSKDGIPVGLLSHLKVQILATSGTSEGVYPFANIKEWLTGFWTWIGAKVVNPIWLSGVDEIHNQGKTPTELVATKMNDIKFAAIEF